ncbi:MAG: hypothetical protein KDG55_18565 [Rhodocyclaceae bacterium]|nr:hypothetical protein [Rhodocyclaceae bacterium]
MISASDLPQLKWPLLAVVLAIACAAALVWHVDADRSEHLQALGNAQRAYRDAHARYIGAQRDEDLVRVVLERFKLLEARGLVGEERRLEWIERIRNARARAGLAQLDFELRPRRSVLKAAEGPLDLTASTMHVSTLVRHEGKLLTFLDTILGENSAAPRISRCSLRRQNRQAEGNALEVECDLDWITVRTMETRP